MATLEETLDKAIEAAVKRALLDAHPVGSIYLTIKDENPSTKFGGTWEKLPASVCLQTQRTERARRLPPGCRTSREVSTETWFHVTRRLPQRAHSALAEEKGTSIWDPHTT